jgi:hypothetical protein
MQLEALLIRHEDKKRGTKSADGKTNKPTVVTSNQPRPSAVKKGL